LKEAQYLEGQIGELEANLVRNQDLYVKTQGMVEGLVSEDGLLDEKLLTFKRHELSLLHQALETNTHLLTQMRSAL
jgi:hypothetical protein